eukprot:353504-Chlamydomonas_euryale.AAC.2
MGLQRDYCALGCVPISAEQRQRVSSDGRPCAACMRLSAYLPLPLWHDADRMLCSCSKWLLRPRGADSLLQRLPEMASRLFTSDT